MGLAASQARLLTITARKADCEFLSMSLSHQKLALARDMERVSAEYQNAINTTKLCYDYYGSGDSQMDLNYGLLMTPSVYNDYYPKLVTDSKNRVILDSKLAAAAAAAGISVEGYMGTPSSDIRNLFIEALCGQNVITRAKADAIESVIYGNTIGLGTTVNITTSTEEMSYSELIKILENNPSINNMNLNAGFASNLFSGLNSSGEIPGVNLGDLGWPARFGVITVTDDKTSIEEKGGKEGSVSAAEALALSDNVTLSDLLNGNNQYYISILSSKGEYLPASGIRALQVALLGSGEGNGASFLNWLDSAFTSLLGGTIANENALNYAYNAVWDLLNPSSEFEDFCNSTLSRVSDAESDLGDRRKLFSKQHDNILSIINAMGSVVDGDRQGYYDPTVATLSSSNLGFVCSDDTPHTVPGDSLDARSTVAINLNNLAKVYLTALVQYLQGVEESDYNWTVGHLIKSNLYDGNKNDFNFTVTAETIVDDGSSNLEASFYDALFNQICMNGWVRNDNITDKQYMDEMLKNGLVYISSISDDGYYYQGNYAADRTLSEVADTEAIARAEAKYNTEKARIQRKEDTIDMKMKSLDTEISSLTTEYDTTKQLINKIIEKSFKRYEA